MPASPFSRLRVLHSPASRSDLRALRRLACAGVPVLALGVAACGKPAYGDAAAKVAAEKAATAGGLTAHAAAPACAPDNGGLTLPPGFCATIFADRVGSPRHIAVAPNGDVFVNLQGARPRGPNESGAGRTGAVLALRDRTGDGRADEQALFGEHGGTGIALAPGWVYVDEGDRITRYPVRAGALEPSGAGEVIVSGLPTGGHGARNMVLDGRGGLYVNVGSQTNACQVEDRQAASPGADPCTELETRAGVWRFEAARPGQRFSPAARWATGIRNAMGLTLNPADGRIYTTQHGRDQLYQNWPAKFTAAQSAELPAEEFMQVNAGDDFGWPYCYYDQNQGKLVLAPEYGGDGHTVGRCASKKGPLAAFPGHWAPMASAFYTGTQFPARYRGGVFIAFHGSWNRAPLPQAGYDVVFQPMANSRPSRRYEVFANGFAGGVMSPTKAAHRPAGVAVAPDGSLYVTDDVHGRIWKIVYTGAR